MNSLSGLTTRTGKGHGLKHPTSKIQHPEKVQDPTSQVCAWPTFLDPSSSTFSGCWILDVGCAGLSPICSHGATSRSYKMTVAALKTVHVNPVYGSYFADPFVWKTRDVYYAIGTGEAEALGRTVGKVFPILQSIDFMQWQFASSALVRPDPGLGNNFWAPEVAEADGTFYLYYSVGHGDKNHQLRVAVSDEPLGPYVDSGKALLELERCPFAIDAHPFRDPDGQWYLFYARDFLDRADGQRA